MLNCWDAGWAFSDIARAFAVSRNVALGVVHRINAADPDALTRKPEQKP